MDSLAEYLEYYGFECEPFVDGVCFFPGAERAEALEQIQHWCDFGAGVIVLEGEPGIGKTCLARQLLEAQPPAQLISELDGSALANLEQMLMVVAAELGVELRECEGGSAMLNQLRQAIKARQHQQQPSLLITVRRAQYLDDACLLALLGLLQGQAPGAAQINVVLFAEPGLSARLRKLDVAEVLINQLSLRPLSGPEVAAYVQQQAHSVAYEGPELFNAAEIKQLQLGSGGVPAEINILAQNLLIDRLYHKPHRASKSMPLPLFVAAAVLGVGALAFLYREQWFGAQPGQPQPATVAQAPTAGPNDVEALVQQALTPAKPVFAGDMQAMPLRVAALAAVALPPADIEWVEGNEPVALPSVSEPQPNKPQPMPPAQAEPQQTELPESQPASEQPLDPQASAELAPEASAELTVPQAEAASAAQADIGEPMASAEAGPGLAGRSDNAGSLASVSSDQGLELSSYTEHEQYLLKLVDSTYVIQLLAVRTTSQVEKFLAGQPNRDQLKIFNRRRDGKTWYVIVLPGFDTWAQVQAGVADLPNARQRKSAWPRSVKIIKADIRSFRGI